MSTDLSTRDGHSIISLVFNGLLGVCGRCGVVLCPGADYLVPVAIGYSDQGNHLPIMTNLGHAPVTRTNADITVIANNYPKS